MLEKFKEMFELQNQLNINTNGDEWAETSLTLQGRNIDWLRCIYMEVAEAIDSLNWKHWKDINSKDNIENVKIELIDIWHFIMSEQIKREGLVQAYTKASKIYEWTINHDSGLASYSELIVLLEDLMRTSLNGKVPLSAFFLTVMKIENFSIDDIYSLYIGKNCLNQFRQDNGYKEGTYIKIWDGEEDNIFMHNIINITQNITYSELYESLEKKYATVVK